MKPRQQSVNLWRAFRQMVLSCPCCWHDDGFGSSSVSRGRGPVEWPIWGRLSGDGRLRPWPLGLLADESVVQETYRLQAGSSYRNA